MDDTLLRTLNVKIVPEMCHDQGRELKQNVNVGHQKTQITDSLRKGPYQHVVALQ